MIGRIPFCKVTPESLPHLLRMLRPLGIKWSNTVRIDAHDRPLDMSTTMPAYRSISIYIERDRWGERVLVIYPHFFPPDESKKVWLGGQWNYSAFELFSLANFVRKARKVKQYETC
jgi:hypothetical protein